MRCPSSVRRPSVVVNFSHFRLLLWNRWTEFNETLQEARSQCPLPSLCFSGWSEKQDGRPGLWLAETFSTSPLKPLNGIQQNLTGSKISTSSTKFVFFGPIGKTRWPPCPLIGWDIFDFSSETAERNSNETWQEARSQGPLQSMCFSGRLKKTRWPPWPLIGWDIFDFSSETTERPATKLVRKQDLNVLYKVCVFRADSKNKMAALASDWLRHFWLLLWNSWTEFNKTWHEARSKSPLQSMCFLGRLEKQDVRPGLWLAETFSTSPLKRLNGLQGNLTGRKISTSSSKFVLFGPISQKGGTLYSGARYVALWASCSWYMYQILIPGVLYFWETHFYACFICKMHLSFICYILNSQNDHPRECRENETLVNKRLLRVFWYR